jgi:hypothetical protein
MHYKEARESLEYMFSKEAISAAALKRNKEQARLRSADRLRRQNEMMAEHDAWKQSQRAPKAPAQQAPAQQAQAPKAPVPQAPRNKVTFDNTGFDGLGDDGLSKKTTPLPAASVPAAAVPAAAALAPWKPSPAHLTAKANYIKAQELHNSIAAANSVAKQYATPRYAGRGQYGRNYSQRAAKPLTWNWQNFRNLFS